MTTAQATEYAAFITNRTIRAQVTNHLLSGVSFICPDCQQIADTNAGCTQCDEARFTAQAAEYDALHTDADDGAYARF